MSDNWPEGIQFPDYKYLFKPNRVLTHEEWDEILKIFFKNKLFDEKFYDTLPDNVKEHFIEREELKEKNKNDKS